MCCFSHITDRKRQKLCLLIECFLSQVVFLSIARFTNKELHQTLVVGKPGILKCSAEGNPAPRFTWSRRDGRILDRQRFRKQPNGNMHVNPVTEDVGGEFTCTIEQNKGSDRTTQKLEYITVSIIGKKSSFYEKFVKFFTSSEPPP